MTKTDSSPSPREADAVPGRPPVDTPSGEQGSGAGLYLVLGLFVAGSVLMVLKLIGLWS